MRECIKYQQLYKVAQEYIKEIMPVELNESELGKYFIGDNIGFSTLEDIYERIIESAQNYQRMPNVIKYNTRRTEIKRVLYDYNLNKIKEADVDDIYYKFRKQFNVVSGDTKRNSWRKWSKSAIDAAKFLCNFKDANDFKSFVKLFDYNVPTRMALPLLISTKISGVGFALACDCLKELGYLNYPKPDVHLIDVFNGLGLSSKDPIDVFETIAKMSDACIEIDDTVTPYKIDKIIWLICSGRFYLDGVTVGRHKDDFINKAKEYLK